jgi:hypothetical protein
MSCCCCLMIDGCHPSMNSISMDSGLKADMTSMFPSYSSEEIEQLVVDHINHQVDGVVPYSILESHTPAELLRCI